MYGSNEIRLNQETMRAIVQNYFSTVMFSAHNVPHVKEIKFRENEFIVKTHGFLDDENAAAAEQLDRIDLGT